MSSLAAIQSWWLATPDAQALVPDAKLWYKAKPEKPPQSSTPYMPYVTFFRVSEPIESWTTGYPMIRATVQFNCHANTPEPAENLAVALRALLTKTAAQPSGARLVIDSQAVMHVLDDDLGLDEGEGLGPDDQDCWIGHFTIEILYTR